MLPDRKIGHEIPVLQLLHESHILHPEAVSYPEALTGRPGPVPHPQAYILFIEYSQGRSYS